MKNSPKDKIHAFCTVDPSYLKREGDQIVCTKCSREMADLDAPSSGASSRVGKRSKGLLCGVVSAVALSSCATPPADNTATEEDAPHYPGVPTQKGEDLPQPVIYVGKIRVPSDPETSSYPKARASGHEPGVVASPYGGHAVDVSGLPPGSVVVDPKFGVESKKYFRI